MNNSMIEIKKGVKRKTQERINE